MNFVDFMRAFDSIHRDSIWNILLNYSFPDTIVRLIRTMYEGSLSCVRVGQENTEWFEINTGVRQGDVLSPFLFNVVLDWVMRRVENLDGGLSWLQGSFLKDLDYADDICLISSSVENLSDLTNNLVQEAQKVGLKINVSKSKTMRLQMNDVAAVEVEGRNLEDVDCFTYLGSEIKKDGDIRRDVNVRIGKAGTVFRSLNKLWSNGGVSVRLKIRLFNSLIVPVLLYGAESWKQLKEVETRLRRFESNCLRKILRINWMDHVSEEELREVSGQESIIMKIRRHRWRYLGHVLRMDGNRIPKQVLNWTPPGSRRRGRPKETYRRTLQRDMRRIELNMEVLEEMAQDRRMWKTATDLWTILSEED